MSKAYQFLQLMSTEYSRNACMCLFKEVPVDYFHCMCKKPVWEVRQANNCILRSTPHHCWPWCPPTFPAQQLWGTEMRRQAVCSLHSCPQWGRQEMPASSQEGLLRWDFPIYFINARRPDTGGDKRSRLQVLIICQASGPHIHGHFLLDRCRPKFSLVPNRKVSPTENHDHPPLSVLARKLLQIACWILSRSGIFCLG